MLYTCLRCDYQTNNRTNFIKHLERKVPCPTTVNDVPISTMLSQLDKEDMGGKYECKTCERKFSARSSLSYHRKHCKGLMDEVLALREQIIQLQALQRNSEHHSGNIDVNNGDGSSTLIANGHHNTVQQIHIHLHPFGQEDVEHVSREFRKQCIKDGITGVKRMLDFVFFNDDKPDNHNVRLRSLKNLLVDVFRDPHWEVKNFNDIVDTMIHKCTDEIVKDVQLHELRNEDKFYEYQAVKNMPKHNVKKAKDHVKAKLVDRRIQTSEDS